MHQASDHMHHILCCAKLNVSHHLSGSFEPWQYLWGLVRASAAAMPGRGKDGRRQEVAPRHRRFTLAPPAGRPCPLRSGLYRRTPHWAATPSDEEGVQHMLLGPLAILCEGVDAESKSKATSSVPCVDLPIPFRLLLSPCQAAVEHNNICEIHLIRGGTVTMKAFMWQARL